MENTTSGQILDYFLKLKLLDDTVNFMTSTMVMIALGFSVMAFGIEFAYSLVKVGAKGEGKMISLERIVTVGIIITFIGIYQPIIYTITTVIKNVNTLVADEVGNTDEFEKYLKYQYGDPAAEFKQKGIVDKLVDVGINIVTSPFWGVAQIVNGITVVLLNLIKAFIYVISLVIFQFFIITGPMAWAVSIIPWMQDQFAKWLGAFLNTGFVFTTLNILEALVLNNMKSINMMLAKQATDDTGNGLIADALLGTTVFNLVVIVLFIIPYWLTSKWIGMDAGGKVFQTGFDALRTATQLQFATAMEKSVAGKATEIGGDALKS